MNKFKRFFCSAKNQAALAGAGLLGLTASSAHAAISTTEIIAAITDAGAAAAVVASAVLVVLVSIKAFKYIRQAL